MQSDHIADSHAAALAATFELTRLTPDFVDNPYPTYRALRRHAPVRRLADGSLFLTRYADLDAIYRNTNLFSSDKTVEFAPKFGTASPLYAHHTSSLVFNDPPLHTRVRRLIAGALTPRAISALEPGLVTLIGGLLDRMEGQAKVDLIEDFAAAIPIEVIGNLLGVPHDERGPLRAWSLAILGALEPAPSQVLQDMGNAAVSAFLSYLKDLVARRRMAPGDPAQDVLTRLIQGEATGERLSEAELLHNCIFLLNAGHETTTNLIGNGLHALLEWPDQKQRLLSNPDLTKLAVEEFLRFESSNQLGNRTAKADTDIGGLSVPAGTRLTLCIGAANRDPAQFADPERLDIGRTPNRHLAFAAGGHQCAGMALARLEGRIALQHFLARFPGFRLAGAPVRGGRVRFRGFLALPAKLR